MGTNEFLDRFMVIKTGQVIKNRSSNANNFIICTAPNELLDLILKCSPENRSLYALPI